MRHITSKTPWLFAAAAAALIAAPLDAANVKHMTLDELVANADRIVRGTVVSRDDATVTAGGGALPATRYRIQVAEVLKGSVSSGDVIEVRLLARPKATRSGAMVRGTMLQDLPEFTVGQEYLFMLTRPSAAGLSTTVGLRQGLFELRGRNGDAQAINGIDNLGLLGAPAAAAARAPGARAAARAVASGPIAYTTLADEIRARVAR